jgi:hypothetical protein
VPEASGGPAGAIPWVHEEGESGVRTEKPKHVPGDAVNKFRVAGCCCGQEAEGKAMQKGGRSIRDGASREVERLPQPDQLLSRYGGGLWGDE